MSHQAEGGTRPRQRKRREGWGSCSGTQCNLVLPVMKYGCEIYKDGFTKMNWSCWWWSLSTQAGQAAAPGETWEGFSSCTSDPQGWDVALWSAGIPELTRRSTIVVLQWKDAVGGAETLAVGLSTEILPVKDLFRERQGKRVIITWWRKWQWEMLQRIIGKTVYEMGVSGATMYLQNHSLSASTKLLLTTQFIFQLEQNSCCFSIDQTGITVSRAAFCASTGYVLVNSFQRQQCCPWIKQSDLFAKRSMDGLDSLQKRSSPCLNSLKCFSTWEQNPEMGMAESCTENWRTELAFSFLCFFSVTGRFYSQGRRIWEFKSSPNTIAPGLLLSKLQGLETTWKVLWCLTGATCPASLCGFT